MIIFLLTVFFVPLVVITTSYCVMTHRIWSYSKRAAAFAREDSSKFRNNLDKQARKQTRSFGQGHYTWVLVCFQASGGGNRSPCLLRSSSKTPAADLGEDLAADEEVATGDTALYRMELSNGNNNGRSNGNRRELASTTSLSDRPQQQNLRRAASSYLEVAANPSASADQVIVVFSKAKKKSLRMTAVVSLLFTLCWLPWCVTMLLLTFEVPLGGKEGRLLLV